MTAFSGQFQYLAGGAITQQGPCRVQFDAQTFTLAPESGAPLVCDLGDFDAVTPTDWEIRLPLYTGSIIVLRQFGKAYETLSHDLLEAYRKRTIQCLLLEDMEEVARFNANYALGPGKPAAPNGEAAEIRLYKTNIAVLPVDSQGFQWRLADVDSVRFDAGAYEAVIESQSVQGVLRVSKLAKRSEEFVAKVNDAAGALATSSAQALHAAFPFLPPDQLQSAAALLREGRPASVAKLAAINAKLPAALATNAVDKDLKPYYDALLAHTAKDSLYAGFKLIRREDQAQEDSPEGGEGKDQDTGLSDDSAADNAGPSAPDADGEAPEALYWFFFPVAVRSGGEEPANVVAWEASSRGGRATYFFRLLPADQAGRLHDPAIFPAAMDTAIRRLNRVLALLNFRRRPIYLSDEELERDPRFHRYAIAARRIPEVREVRASLLGRAMHSSLEAWQEQVKTILAKAGVAT